MTGQRVDEVTKLEATPEGYNCHLRAEGRTESGAADLALEAHPYKDGPPEDGILDLDLVCAGPGEGGSGAAELNLENLENFWSEGGHPLRGVRVHGKDNVKEVTFA